MKRILLIGLVLCCLVFSASAQQAKYIFYFIGDGMGPNHVVLGGGDSLCFATFPAKGTLTTHSADSDITDSAAAGTALATGHKTSNGTIGMDSKRVEPLRSIAYDARQAGLKVGIMTTVSIDHATPASFYASAASRKMADQIAVQLPTTGFDLFAGSGFVKPLNLFDILADSAYSVVYGKNAVLKGDKVVWIQDKGKDVGQLPYAATERKADDMTLPIMTDRAISFLAADSLRGFFVMIEGGKIDWAAHDNNPINVRGEVRDFDQAVRAALAFYQKHPTQTLIVVTADHETGGLSLDPVAWSSTGHTATRVPIYAIGVGAERFAFDMDNTQVAPIIGELFTKGY